jgi:hypothetical protein
MTSRLSDSDYVTTDQEDSRAADAELDDLRPRDTQECPVKMAKLGVSMHACMVAYLTACLTVWTRDLTAGFTVCPPDCRQHWQVPHLQEGQRRREQQCSKLLQLGKESWGQQQLQLRQQQPDGSGAPTTSTSNDDHRAGAQLHPGQEWRDRPRRARLKPCWGCDTRNRGPSGPLGVVLTSPPAVLGGPVKTGRRLPVLGEVEDSDVSDFDDSHDVIISEHELGLDLGLDFDSWTLRTNGRQQHRLQTDSRSCRRRWS